VDTDAMLDEYVSVTSPSSRTEIELVLYGSEIAELPNESK
jgi:hypothetical protein